jgi:hypothetical protein
MRTKSNASLPIMTPTIVRTFDELESVQAARAALIDIGFDADRIELTVLQDEAGPAQGNFVSGNGAVSTGGNTSFKPEPPSDDPYRQDYQPVRYRAGHVLVVTVTNDAELARAEQALERFGGIDVGRRTP